MRIDPDGDHRCGHAEHAEFFRISARLGTVEPGKLADVVLIDGDPLRDIRAMRRVERVMLNGRWITWLASDKPK